MSDVSMRGTWRVVVDDVDVVWPDDVGRVSSKYWYCDEQLKHIL